MKRGISPKLLRYRRGAHQRRVRETQDALLDRILLKAYRLHAWDKLTRQAWRDCR